MNLQDLDKLLTPFEARHGATRRLEQLNELIDAGRLEIKLVGIGRDATGTAGNTIEVWLPDDEARIVVKSAMTAVQRTFENANRSLEELGVEIEE